MTLPVIMLPVLDPEIVSFDIGSFHFALRWYALAYVAGFVVAWRWFVSIMSKPSLWATTPPMNPAQAEKLLTWIVVGVIIGGRLGYVLFYNPGYYAANPLDALAIWQGGMSFHGGFAGLIVATVAYCKLNGIPVSGVADTISIVCTPGLFFGRVANFINSELWGAPSDLPWAVVFPTGPASVCPDYWAGACSRHPSQLYEALLEGAIPCVLMAWLVYKRSWLHSPWRTTGLFFAAYGFARFLVEFVRIPDAQFLSETNQAGHVVRLTEDIGLTMGQTLSLPMILIGLTVLAVNFRRRS